MKNSRQLQADATRQKILDKGIALIEKQGYDKVTIEDITNAAGVSIGTFYHYFDSKDAYYYSYINSTFRQVDNSLKEHMDLPLIYNLSHYLTSWFKEVKQSGPDYIAHWLGHAGDKDYHERVNQKQDVSMIHIGAVNECFEGYIEKGELSSEAPIAELSEMIVTVLYGIDVRFCMTNGLFDLEAWVALLVNHIKVTLDPYMK